MCCGGGEKNGERERDEHFDFAKRGKTTEGGSLNFSGSISSFSFKWFSRLMFLFFRTDVNFLLVLETPTRC